MLFNGETMMQKGRQRRGERETEREEERESERKGSQPIVFKRLSLRVSPLNVICLHC